MEEKTGRFDGVDLSSQEAIDELFLAETGTLLSSPMTDEELTVRRQILINALRSFASTQYMSHTVETHLMMLESVRNCILFIASKQVARLANEAGSLLLQSGSSTALSVNDLTARFANGSDIVEIARTSTDDTHWENASLKLCSVTDVERAISLISDLDRTIASLIRR